MFNYLDLYCLPLLKIVVEDAHGATLWLRQVRDNFTTLGIATGIAVTVDLEQLGWIGWVENFDLLKVRHFHITKVKKMMHFLVVEIYGGFWEIMSSYKYLIDGIGG